LNNAYGLWSTVTHFAPPSGTSFSIPMVARMDRREAGSDKSFAIGFDSESRMNYAQLITMAAICQGGLGLSGFMLNRA